MRYLMFFILPLGTFGAQAFDSFEHIRQGDEVQLNFPSGLQSFDAYPYASFEKDIEQYFGVAVGERRPRKQYLDFAGYKITLGEVIAFAGDYFTTPNLIISDAKTEEEMERRFLLAFSTMLPGTQDKSGGNLSLFDYLKQGGNYSVEAEEAFRQDENRVRDWQTFPNPFFSYKNAKRPDLYDPLDSQKQDTFPMLEALRNMVREEFGAIIKESAKAKYAAGNYIASKRGASESLPTIVESSEGSLEILSDVHTALIRTKSFIDKISGVLSDFWNGDPTFEYTKILAGNLDHFGDDAVKAYKVGHRLALIQARAAGKTSDSHGLNLAYALDGFAMHFLTDLFSSGHIRVPRRTLYADYGSNYGGPPANAMHDEDGYFGLKVHNKNHMSWVAYGDYAYFSPRSKEANRQIYESIRASIKEVWDAFLQASRADNYAALQYIPQVRDDENHHPLFKIVTANEEIRAIDRYVPNTTPTDVEVPATFRTTQVVKVRDDLENIHSNKYNDYSHEGPKAVSWSWFQSYLPSSVGVLAINQWDKYNEFDFRSVINKEIGKNLMAKKVNFECHLTSDPETKSALVSDYAFVIDLKAQNFRGFKKRQKKAAFISHPEEGIFDPESLVEEHEAQGGNYYVISDAVAKKIIKNCFMLTRGKGDPELYTVSAISSDTDAKAANLAVSDATEHTSDGLLEEFPLRTEFH